MTLDEAAARYRIPPQVLHDYAEWAQTSEIDDRALERLGLMTTLHDIGFSNTEIARYLRAQNDLERLRLLNTQRHIILTEIHEREHALSTLDVLRHQLHIAQNC